MSLETWVENSTWEKKVNKILLSFLIPKIPWDQKLVDCNLDNLCKEKYFFSIFFFLTSEFHIFHKLSRNTKHIQSDSVWARTEVLLKVGIRFICPVFFEEFLHASMWLKLPKDWRTSY
jgi:hypothetical protein